MAALLLSYHSTALCASESDISANALCISLFLRIYFLFIYSIWVGHHGLLLLLRWPIM